MAAGAYPGTRGQKHPDLEELASVPITPIADADALAWGRLDNTGWPIAVIGLQESELQPLGQIPIWVWLYTWPTSY